MVVAYLMVVSSNDIDKQFKIAADMMKKKGIVDVSVLYGEYDMIIKIDVPTMSELQNFVVDLKKQKGIERTNTMIAIA